ncbi:MAG: preprotein translocase subunit SecB [Rubritalea sp.]|jgi:preprotein translocase subunit SecB
MKPAPLQLVDYFIIKLNLEANPLYDEEGEKGANLDTISVTQEVSQEETQESDGTTWRVAMNIKQEIPKDRNIPYQFELEIHGEIYAFPVFEGKRLETVIKANAPAMLFGAAREIIRAATGRGPFPAVVIPSTNFIEPQQKTAVKRVAAKKTVAKKIAKKATKTAAKKKNPTKKS